jgi:hypothetical protein
MIIHGYSDKYDIMLFVQFLTLIYKIEGTNLGRNAIIIADNSKPHRSEFTT